MTSHEIHELGRRTAVLERRFRLLQGFAAAALIALVAYACVSLEAAPAQNAPDVLRVRGIIVVDDAGRERVILGAPVADVSDDPRLGTAAGMIVLDSVGRLNVAVGLDNPLIDRDGKLAERIGVSAGVTIYDMRTGQERGGMATFGDGRANVCLDYGAGLKEAACMTVAGGDQYAALLLNGMPHEKAYDRVTLYVGADGSGSMKVFGGGANQGGMMIRAGRGAPTLTVYDSTGSELAQLPGRASP